MRAHTLIARPLLLPALFLPPPLFAPCDLCSPLRSFMVAVSLALLPFRHSHIHHSTPHCCPTHPHRADTCIHSPPLHSCLLSLLSGRALRSLFSIYAPRPLFSVVLIPSSPLPNVSLLPGVHPSPFNYVYIQPFSLPSAPSLLHLVSHLLPQPPSRYTHSFGASSTHLPSRLPPSPSRYKFLRPPPLLSASFLSFHLFTLFFNT
ncbi:hypothetical protein C8J57DRAFT_1518877 [Mycena rebaudengoi]|nr:hypothetical protein C8J57DRAFT_1518877 [Mycena rebaudengoi]